jgi:hypothetical protein
MSSSSPPTQTVYTNSNPPAYVQPYLTEIAAGASDIYKNTTVPQYYQNSTVTPFSSQTTEALGMAEQIARNNQLNPQAYDYASNIMQTGGVNPLTSGAIGNMSNIANGTNQITTGANYQNLLNGIQNGNPYFQQALDTQANRTADNVNAQFSQAGRYGSGAHAGTLAREIGNSRNQAMSQQYNQDIASQMQGIQGLTSTQGANIANQGNTSQSIANLYQNAQDYGLRTALATPGLQMSQYNDAAQLANVGSQYEANSQAQLQDQINRWNSEQMSPWNRLNLYSNAVNGVSQGGTSTTLTQLPQQSFGQRIIGGASAGGALGSMAGVGGGLLGAGIGGLMGLL